MSDPRAPAHPLTEAQAGLWYAQRLDPANPLFNTGQSIAFTGPLDRDAFAAALAQAVDEADALALRLVDDPAGPYQVVDPANRPVLDIIDLSGEDDPHAAAQAAIARDMATPVDPTRDRLAAERLFVLGPQHHIWQQRIHHLAIDGYGMILITQRVAELYTARLRVRMPGAPAPGIAAAFTEDAAYRASDRRAKDGAYWRALFADRPEVASLATGSLAAGSLATGSLAAAPSLAHGFHRRAVEIDAEAFARLRARAERISIPWPDIVTALSAAYVQRHTQTPEVIVGVPFMARLGSAAARVPAMLMNVLPLRVAVPSGVPLDDFLHAVAGSLVRARRHGRYRSEQLRRDLKRVGGQRRLHGPLINLLPFDETPRFEGLTSRLEVLSTGPVEDITFTFRLHGTDGLRLEVDANPALYPPAVVEAHALRLKHFIEATSAADRLDDVPTATPAEAERHLVTLNATAHPVPDTTLAALIERTMAAMPTAPALRFAGMTLDYAGLEARSRALAETLAAIGGVGDSLIAVALPRSFELVIALVAILRAGAAYLPLDLAQPDARLSRILTSARPRLVLARTEDAGRFEGKVEVLAPEHWPHAPLGLDLPQPEPGDAAYVIYTSGSTGEPKGVVIEHRAIVNRLEWMREHYGFGPQDRILQKTPATFDVSVWEFFLPLLTGACLVIAPPEAHRDPLALARILREETITTAHFVPSMLAAFLAEPSAQGLVLARVFCSGEELPADLRDRFHRTLKAGLHNLYGPTEAAVDVSFWPAGPEDRANPVPIGFPVWNTRLYVLDAAGRPQPPDVPGHLFLGGVQLARGYLGRPDLTAERFRPDPFRPGERVYATGDLALWRADGAVVFLGRSDHQIKIRGLRVELGEVEAAFMASGLVRQAGIVAREDRGTKRIVAYLVREPGQRTAQGTAQGTAQATGQATAIEPGIEPAMDIAALKADLASRLPDYMVPAAFVVLDALPVTANGKLDRAALPAPDFAGTGSRAPETPTERRLAALFAAQLAIDGPIAAEDDFFALGGDSLHAVALLLKVREQWGHDPGLGALFARPTVEGFARLIEAEGDVDAGLGPLVTLAQGEPDRPPLFVIHPAGGLSWCYGRLARALSPRRTVHGLQAPALAAGVATPGSLEALARDYVARIRRLQPRGPYHLLGWSVGGILAQAMAVQLREDAAEVGIVALLDSYPCDVWRGEPDPGEDGALKALLAIAGHDPDRLPALALNRAAVLAFLRATTSPLGRLPEAALDGVVRVVAGNNALVRGHFHRRYDGVLTHFRAALDHQGRDLSPDLWAPYAARIDVIDVPSLHAHLTGPEATARVAPVLARALAQADSREKVACATAV
ncbi:amino acid adenylation domain-containing protein [Ancylobacter amanitiformis]|uniref:Enterobactin synthetase component F n=1 Tax=Ancylobacter amanitiformis TaxID=217069 RepID=A0ABU0LS26_9HYPH|nr:amino acid adenylation domain-containing protein [Ancylobacter amanitiformis]MDQ0511455.1 enterobactin synthetase component F [Ancylobacter amanitiformis]